MSERVAIFIDGSNFFYKLRDKQIDLPRLTSFKYGEFCNYLARDRQKVYCRYYICAVSAVQDDKKGQQLRIEQNRLFNNLQYDSIEIKKGFLMKRDNGKYHEKGVDVELAVDIVSGAFRNEYDTAIIVSSDTDLLPAIKVAKDLGKQIEYIGFSHKPSYALMRHADLNILLLKGNLQEFVAPELSQDTIL